MIFKRFSIGLSTFRVADGIYLERRIVDAYTVVDGLHQRNDIHVGSGIICPYNLRSELVELALAALLWLLGAEHRTNIIQILRSAALIQMMLDEGACNWCRTFGAQDILVITALKGKHFFGNNIRELADATGNEFRLLHDGGANFFEVKLFSFFMDNLLQCLPFSYLIGQDIIHSNMRFKS